MDAQIKAADELMGERAKASGYARMNGASEAEISKLKELYQEAKRDYERICREAGEPLYGFYSA